MPEPIEREPDKCDACECVPWRIAVYYRRGRPQWLCAACFEACAEILQEVALFKVRYDRERRLYFGGIKPLLEWLYEDPVRAIDREPRPMTHLYYQDGEEEWTR